MKFCKYFLVVILVANSFVQPAKAEDIGDFLGKVVRCSMEAKGKTDKLNKMIKDVKSMLGNLDKKNKVVKKPSAMLARLIASKAKITDAADLPRYEASRKALCVSQTKQLRRSLAGLANEKTRVEKLRVRLQSTLSKVGNGTLACIDIFPEGVTKIISWLSDFANSLSNFGSNKTKVDYRDLRDVPTGCDAIAPYGSDDGEDFTDLFKSLLG